MTADAAHLVPAWLAAAGDERIAAELEGVYEFVAAAIESRGPACWASGRCCNLDAAGHRLYATGLEAAYTVARLPTGGPDARTVSSGSAGVTPAALTPTSLSAAVARGGCPFQLSNLCGVHAIKPLGCRVYFCDHSVQRWQEELSETMLAQIRAIHARHAIEYRYAEWRRMLALFLPAVTTAAGA
jgi:Fe-S-cluster containining protein